MEAFEPFLSGAQHRDLIRAVLTCAAHARGLGLVVGDGSEKVAAALARAWPHRDVNLLQIDAKPTRVTPFMGGQPSQTLVLEDRGTDVALRSALRQDPDVIVVTSLEDAAAPLIVAAAQTGHVVVLATNGDEWLRKDGIEFVIELRDGVLHRVTWRGNVLAEVRDGVVHVERSLVPEALYPPPSPTRMAQAIAERRAALISPRAAWLPVTSETSTANSRIGIGPVLRSAGWAWPRCAACSKDLAFVLQLDLAELPEEFEVPLRDGLVELFVCREGCEDGVHLERVLPSSTLEAVTAPPSELLVLEPGAISNWRRFEEEPGWEDRARLGLPEDEDGAPKPLHADKLGGWPAWQQGAEWPADDAVLLFQLDEGETRIGGKSPTWSFEEARVVAGLPPARVVDSEAPRHFPSLMTGEATAFIFMMKDGALKFVWQTG